MGIDRKSDSMPHPVEAIVALGGNIGDVKQCFIAARTMLTATSDIRLLESSLLYRSAPMGPQDQADYLNAVVAVTTTLSALQLLHRLQKTELYFGRRRDGPRWGERTLDLDLVAYNDTQMQSSELTLPHPGMQDRLFVLQPLRDIRPDWLHPATGKRASSMLQQLFQTGETPLDEGEIW